MSAYEICVKPQQDDPADWDRQTAGMKVSIIFVLITAAFYTFNAISSICQIRDAERPARRRRRHERPELSTNPLSTWLAAAFGVVIIFATWPQSLEGATLLVAVLAQASLLGWHDHDPDKLVKDLTEKMPDVAAVIVATYALGFGREEYLKDNPNDQFKFTHDPKYQMIAVYVCTGTGAVVGIIQQLLVYRVNKTLRNDTEGSKYTLGHERADRMNAAKLEKLAAHKKQKICESSAASQTFVQRLIIC